MLSRFLHIGLVALALAGCVTEDEPPPVEFVFGDDTGAYPRDGECDDPRFAGPGLASSFEDANIRGDASDCRRLYDRGQIRLARTKAQWDLAQCESIDYGNNRSQWANDNECDDPRFTGPGVDNVLIHEDLMSDARDCRALCRSGQIWLR